MTETKWKTKDIKNHTWQLVLLILLCLQVLLVLYYGGRKAGYHEDEYYSFYSTNRTAGLITPDREWVDKDIFEKEFSVQEGEQFNYGLVSTVQSWDVHPPFYYFILHTACSFFPDVFSKWLGIGVNLLAYIINFFLLAWLTYMVTDKNRILTVLVSAVHGFNAVIISGVLFIRMYEWLTVFVLLCAVLHVRAMKKKDVRFHTFLLPLMVVTYLGFLTQYYYIIFLGFMAAGFCIWLLRSGRKLSGCIKYGLCCGVSVGLAIISYPASLSHIFRGYRGTGAASEFFDTSNTGERLRFFGGLMNEYVFDGYLWLLLLLIGIMAVTLLVKKRSNKNVTVQPGLLHKHLPQKIKETHYDYKPYLLLLFTVVGYFFTVSKTALLLYETSNRYQLPVYGMLLMLVIAGVYILAHRILQIFSGNALIKKVGVILLFAIFLMGDAHELVSGKVLFLYEEDAARIAYAKENAHVPVVILYNDATPYHVWWCSDELMEYDGAYFVSEGNKEKITDEIISSSKRLIVYAADYDTKDESLQMVLESSPNLSEYRLVSRKSLWSVYEFN